jgi:hypothetical protein
MSLIALIKISGYMLFEKGVKSLYSALSLMYALKLQIACLCKKKKKKKKKRRCQPTHLFGYTFKLYDRSRKAGKCYEA